MSASTRLRESGVAGPPAPRAPPRRAREPASAGGGPRGGWLRRLSTVLIIAGTLLLADAGLTVVWQEPVSAVFAWLTQGELADDLARLEAGGPSADELAALAALEGDRRRIAFLARALERRAGQGQAVGRIALPSIDQDLVVVEGSDTAALHKGPGVYDDTRFPGVGGTSAIAGHRTTYGAPFNDIDKVEKGDRVSVTMPYARFDYVVEGTKIVAPTAVEVVDDVGYDRLVLSACHPLYSAAKRIVVFAKLQRVTPRGATLRTG